jgi:sugar phosphate isomerase/epimerase
VIDAVGDLAPNRLSDTGRRELRHLLRSVEVALIALHLPTRRPFDTVDQLEDRLRRAESAFTLGYELGTNLVLARLGAIPPESNAPGRETFVGAARELGRRADHRGVRLAVETGPDPGDAVRALLDELGSVGLAASIDPSALLEHGHDPIAATRALGPWVAHAYATDAPAPAGRYGGSTTRLDWEAYLAALEEANYRGFLTVWPDPDRDPGPSFAAVADRLSGL